MATQDEQSESGQASSNQSETTGHATGNEAEQINTAETSEPVNDQDASTSNNKQPKFQSKHNERTIRPPQKENDSQDRDDTQPEKPATETEQPAHPKSETTPLDSTNDTKTREPVQPEAPDPSSAPEQVARNQSSKLDVQSQSGTSAAGSGGGSPTSDSAGNASSGDTSTESSSGNKKKWIIAAGVIVLLMLGFGGYAAYAQYVLPKQEPKSYLQRLSDMDSGQYELKVASETDEFNVNVTSDGKFSYDPAEPKKTEFASSLGISLGQGIVNINVKSDVRFVDGVAYVRLNNTQALQNFLPGLDSETWYSWEPDDTISPRSLASNTCTEEDKQALEEYFEADAFDSIVLNNPQRHDWFGVERNGRRVHHYSGEIPGKSVKKVLLGTARVTGEDCVSADEIKDEHELDQTTLAYDLYTGDDYDELAVRGLKEDTEKASVILTTSNYNREVSVTAPSNSTPVDELLQGSFGQGSEPMFGESDLDTGGGFNPGGPADSGNTFSTQ